MVGVKFEVSLEQKTRDGHILYRRSFSCRLAFLLFLLRFPCSYLIV